MTNALPEMQAIVREHRGLAILRALQREVSHGANEEVMRAWLDLVALGGTREVVRAELDRLAGLGVIQVEWRGFAGETKVFWLTEKGLDYLEFRTAVEDLPRIGPANTPY